MNTDIALERCFSFINCHLAPERGRSFAGQRHHGVTISRQTGSGGHTVAEQLAAILQQRYPGDGCDWAIFDRNLVEKVLADHHLPARLARFMPEDRVLELTDTMDELFGLHPPSHTLVRQVSDTIYRLAELGNVIIIGRGANVITARLKHMFHVRLVGSLEKRLQFLEERDKVDQKTALDVIHREDLGRKRYLQKYLGKNIDDPLLYHLVINTDLVTPPAAAKLIADAMSQEGVPEQGKLREERAVLTT